MDEHSRKDPAMALRARSLPWEKPLPDRFAGHEHVRLAPAARRSRPRQSSPGAATFTSKSLSV
jgi:hypothetical protein